MSTITEEVVDSASIAAASTKRKSLWALAARNTAVIFGGSILLIMLVIAILAPWISPYGPTQKDRTALRQPPSWEHWLGTTHMGEDVLSQIIYGTRGVIVVGFLAAFIATVIAITIGVIEGAMLMRFVRSATLQATGQDFVRTAAAKGLTRNQALVRHGLPTVGLSIITVLGLQVAGIIVGSVVIEQLFSLPGIGRMLVADVGNRDLTKVQGELLVLTSFVLIIGFVVDLVHRMLDPRQREAA